METTDKKANVFPIHLRDGNVTTIHKETLQLINYIEKLYKPLMDEEPRIEIKGASDDGRIAECHPFEGLFIIYEEQLLKFLEKKDDKDAAIFGIAAHEVSHAYSLKKVFLDTDIDFVMANEEINAKEIQDEAEEFYKKAKKEEKSEDEIVGYAVKNIIQFKVLKAKVTQIIFQSFRYL